MTGLVISLLIVLATVPITMLGVRIAKRHRRASFAAASLLLLFGVSFNITPPPPPRIEREESEDAEDEASE